MSRTAGQRIAPIRRWSASIPLIPADGDRSPQTIEQRERTSMPDKPKTPRERSEFGKSLREKTPLEAHAEWTPGTQRPDPVGLVEEQNEGRTCGW